MSAKQILPNQHGPLHFIYGRGDCCLCAAENKLLAVQDMSGTYFALIELMDKALIDLGQDPSNYTPSGKIARLVELAEPHP